MCRIYIIKQQQDLQMPGVHRNTDSRKCGAKTQVAGNQTVYANGKLISVQGDPNSHGGGSLNASINPGTVYVAGREMVVNGSTASADNLCPLPVHHCGPDATQGSENVFAFE